jgi:predicted ArsR family transcriptional regulator
MDAPNQVSPKSTRGQILLLLERRGRATVEELATALGITTMAVRLQLATLEADRLVSKQSRRKGRGRPSQIYMLTEEAQDALPKQYGLLADHLLEGMKQVNREQLLLASFSAADTLARHYDAQVADKDLDGRMTETGRILEQQGVLAEWERKPNGQPDKLHIYGCPYFRVAQHHREVCAMEERFLGKLLDSEMKLQDCILDGAEHCVFNRHPDTGTTPEDTSRE